MPKATQSAESYATLDGLVQASRTAALASVTALKASHKELSTREQVKTLYAAQQRLVELKTLDKAGLPPHKGKSVGLGKSAKAHDATADRAETEERGLKRLRVDAETAMEDVARACEGDQPPEYSAPQEPPLNAKRAVKAYYLYQSEKRKNLRKAHPDLRASTILEMVWYRAAEEEEREKEK
ncbi:hypothetical protein JCM11641_001405 [Rhodosporidiobolus odoratus]